MTNQLFDPLQLHFDLCDLHTSYSYFISTPVVAERPRTITPTAVVTSILDTALAALRNTGRCVMVQTPDLMTKEGATEPFDQLFFDHASVTIIYFANEILGATPSGSGKRAQAMATVGSQLIAGSCSPPNYGKIAIEEFRHAQPSEFPEGFGKSLTGMGADAWLVRAVTQMQLAILTRTTFPEMECEGIQSPQVVTLSCDDPAAVIYYTTNGSAPRSSNPLAQKYTVPITIAAASTLRVGAQTPTLAPSDIATAIFT